MNAVMFIPHSELLLHFGLSSTGLEDERTLTAVILCKG